MPDLFPSQCDPLPQNVSTRHIPGQADAAVDTQCSNVPGTTTNVTSSYDAVWEQTKDMHVELLFHFQRVTLKLALPPASIGEFHAAAIFLMILGEDFDTARDLTDMSKFKVSVNSMLFYDSVIMCSGQLGLSYKLC